jgi:5'-nucleotidase
MSRLLLTNDDGVDSPALVPFARALRRRHDVTVVAPDGERSWIGKAVSRHAPITLVADEREGLAVHHTSGTPADATQLGVHHVAGGRIDVVVSGINIGFNHGVAFLLSSGTVGAAIEGWITGLPAVAFSTGTWGDDWDGWRDRVLLPEARPEWERLSALCTDILDEVLAVGLARHADVVTVNVPFRADADTPRRVTDLARIGYGGLFQQLHDGQWHHQTVDLREIDDLAGTDVEAAGEHVVTITPVRMPSSPAVPSDVRDRLERH